MTQVICPFCRQQIAGTSVRCPVCRNPLPIQVRAAANAQREAEKQRKEAARQHAEEKAAGVDRMNAEIEAKVSAFEGLLADTLARDDYIDFDELKERFDPSNFPFEPGELGRVGLPPAFIEPPSRPVKPPSLFARVFAGGTKKYQANLAAETSEHEAAVVRVKEEYETQLAKFEVQEKEREEKLSVARAEHEAVLKDLAVAVEKQHEAIDRLHESFDSGAPDAIVEYFSRVLERSPYPDEFPKWARLGFVAESRQLVAEVDLPPLDVIPAVRAYRYVKAHDSVVETARPQSQVHSLYSFVVAQMALRTLHELFEADRTRKVETIALSCFVDTVDAATGKPIRPCLLTVRTTRDTFTEIDLSKIELAACLKALNASVSKSPSELLAVRPLVDFSMVDPRFIDERDVLSGLDERPNLMELSPTEFENLITNLFEKMGLETRLTQASRDGGVDCVAWDKRPILGGKVVIQAKRYKNTVGVSAVRDLFGTMQNEGASKGILVTTSGYGKASFEFAEGKPMELLSGSNLLYLLAEHAGIQAKIEPPEDWVDPEPDAEPLLAEGADEARTPTAPGTDS